MRRRTSVLILAGVLAAGGTTLAGPAAAEPSGGPDVLGPTWVSTTGDSAHFDLATDVAVDPDSGTVFVTGRSFAGAGPVELLTAAYTADGQPVWTARLGGDSNSFPTGGRLALDRERSRVYVTGARETSAGAGRDVVVAAYSYAGAPIWVAEHDETGRDDTAADIGVNQGDGTVFVTGSTSGSRSGDVDVLALAFDDAGGELLWSTRTSGPGTHRDFGAALVPANDGGMIVTGETEILGGFDSLTVAYSSTGETRWTRRLGVAGSTRDSTTLIALDPSGTVVYVAGTSAGDGLVAALQAGGGAVRWQRASGISADLDAYTALTVDPTGGVLASGSAPVGVGQGLRTVSYDVRGDLRWASELPGGPSFDAVRGLEYDPIANRVLVTAERTTNPNRFLGVIDVYALYDVTGALRAQRGYTAGPRATAAPAASALDITRHQLIVTGYLQRAEPTDPDYLTLAFPTL